VAADQARHSPLVGNAKKNADQIAGQAKTQAGQLLAEVNADAERRRAAAQREVDDLTRQKDSIASHLARVRQLLDGQLPGMDAVQAAQTKPAIAGDSNK
jgi:cell division septum initiation protein DivIVA